MAKLAKMAMYVQGPAQVVVSHIVTAPNMAPARLSVMVPCMATVTDTDMILH